MTRKVVKVSDELVGYIKKFDLGTIKNKMNFR